ncbi:MAG: gamma-glutamyl-gamma-aminobutyrate hydrolase family protein, partial [Sedimentisphaerales bacterium]|nr:gamma-glutamyl-gamma-aminobutyrate hydrolase family protein [Sedimentisphaerales bacterium]
MSGSPETPHSSDATRPPRRRRRWLRRIGVALVALIGIVLSIYAALRFVYPRWVSTRLPADAPRIAFSLDNSLIGWIGVTDVTYQRVMTQAGGRLIVLRPDAAGEPEVDPRAVEALLETQRIDGILLAGGGDIDPNIYGGQSDATMLVHRL